MAKVNRNTLKEIVKECLVEILSEGLSGDGRQLKENTARKSIQKKSAPKRRLNPNFKKNTDNVVNSVTSDPVMASIFSDTAQTTLQEQTSAENRSPVVGGDTASQIASQNNPTELFGESSQNWAALAFSD